MQIVTAIGPNIVDELFDNLEKAHATLPDEGRVRFGARLYKIQSQPVVVTAAAETWEKIKDLFKRVSRNGWAAAKVQFDSVMQFIGDRARELGKMAEEYEALLLAKLQELMRETSEFLLKSASPQVQIGQQLYTLNSINLETKLLFTASVEASVATLGKFLGTGEATIKGTYSVSTASLSTGTPAIPGSSSSRPEPHA